MTADAKRSTTAAMGSGISAVWRPVRNKGAGMMLSRVPGLPC